MARSLTVKHEEHATTSRLFTGFLLLSVAWMLASAFGAGATADAIDPGPSVQAPAAPPAFVR